LQNSPSFFCSEIGVLAKAYLAHKDFEQAESNAHSVYEKAVGMKYRWAEMEAGSLELEDLNRRSVEQ
jgi:hypothetical protein